MNPLTKALIVSGGTAPSEELLRRIVNEGTDLIIAADSGAAVLLKYGIDFNLALGDFDSLEPALLEKIRQDKEIITYEVRKDFTDTEAAYREAVRRGAREIVILGATGTRYDHFMGNLALLKIALKENVRVRIIDDHNEIFMTGKSALIEKQDGFCISIFAVDGDVPDLSFRNVSYPLEHHHLTPESTLTVSNEFLEGPAVLDFKEGCVLVIISRD